MVIDTHRHEVIWEQLSQTNNLDQSHGLLSQEQELDVLGANMYQGADHPKDCKLI